MVQVEVCVRGDGTVSPLDGQHLAMLLNRERVLPRDRDFERIAPRQDQVCVIETVV